MIHAWAFTILVLAAFRATRLLGWDDFPPVQDVRDRVTGATWVQSSADTGSWAYKRPLIAGLLHCAFCLGFWVSAAFYTAWLVQPHWTLYAASPLALSGAVGLVAKKLDP